MDFDDLYLVWKLMTWGLRIYTCFVDIVSLRAKKTGKNSVKNPSEDSHFPSFDSQDKMSISEALPWWILMIYTLFESLWPGD